MTEIVKHLTCDRCGDTVILHLDEAGDFFERLPQGWVTVAYQCKTIDLCPVCGKLHDLFMRSEATVLLRKDGQGSL